MFDSENPAMFIANADAQQGAAQPFNLDAALADVAKQFAALPHEALAPKLKGGKWRSTIAMVRRTDQQLLSACHAANHAIDHFVHDAAALLTLSDVSALRAEQSSDALTAALARFQDALNDVSVEDFAVYLGEKKSKGGVRLKDKAIAVAVSE